MKVRRTLPQRARPLIGGMNVPPHPHIGLRTVSRLFSGEIEHRDSLGNHTLVRPGEPNLMTGRSAWATPCCHPPSWATPPRATPL